MGNLSGFATARLIERINEDNARNQTDHSYYRLLPGGIYGTYENIATVTKEIKPHLLIIDGAALVKTDKFRGSRWERIIEVIERFKELALREEDLRIILTFHYGKGGAGKQENIYGGMAISQFASIILSFEYERPEDRNNPSPVQYRNLKLIKGREGESGTVRVLYDMRRSIISQDEVLVGEEVEVEAEENNVEQDAEYARESRIEEI